MDLQECTLLRSKALYTVRDTALRRAATDGRNPAMTALLERDGHNSAPFYEDARHPIRKHVSPKTKQKRTARKLPMKFEDEYAELVS